MNFNDIVGYKNEIEYLKNAINTKELNHSYLFFGGEGCGKKTIANIFSKALLCEGLEADGNPCEKCGSCIKIESTSHPDVIRVKSQEDKKQISIGEIREKIIDTLNIKPFFNKYKIYIIEEGELLTHEAQNALLKSLEEPPEYVIFIILCKNIKNILPTIKSRVYTLNINGIKDTEIEDYLTNKLGIDKYKVRVARGFSGGSLGRAISFVENDYLLEMGESIKNILFNIGDSSVEETVEALNYLKDYKDNINDILDFMMCFYRDLLLFKAVGDIDLLIFKEDYEKIKNTASITSYEKIQEAINGIVKAKERLIAKGKFDVIIELLIYTLKDVYEK